jgi:lysine 2,3-aminomutase
MQTRLTPYFLSLIDWSNPLGDPIRKQFLPLGDELLEDHPLAADDSLDEEGDRVSERLVHRYADRVLFLPLTVCPIYCVFCTRSRLVGGSTALKSKATYGASRAAWASTFEYLRAHAGVEDVVVSGGDAAMLRPDDLEYIGRTLLAIPHVRRVRYATRALSAWPMKVTSDDAWVQALERVQEDARRSMKEVCVHTHVNVATELTAWSAAAARRLFELGVRVRNQSVLLRGVNDAVDPMRALVKRLSHLQFQPYLVYLHDLVPGCEHLRTRVRDAQRVFKELLGTTSGYNVPRFVCDLPGGGGKREVSSCECYDEELGVSAWVAPAVKPGRVFYYYDPIDRLPEAGRRLWQDRGAWGGRLAAFRANAQATLGGH